ncbi:Clp protease [Vibrio phage 2.275.O._10N.286.54.E11]|nr:Clp protease [Vibrio phage 2.275.O._10N.286.54.E11]
MSSFFPMVVESTNSGERVMSIDSCLLKERIIVIDGGVDPQLSKLVNSQLLYLDSISNEDIKIHLKSPGGCVHSGMSIQDTMDMCRSDIVIIGSGELCSMGCYLLSMGTPGKRFVTKRAQIMAHQVSSGTSGHIEDQRASFNHTDKLNDLLGKEIANAAGMSHSQYLKYVDRDFWASAEEAVLFGKTGFADGVITGERSDDGELLIKRRSDLEAPVKKKPRAKKVPAKKKDTTE